jgi:hypothetical protein
MLANGPQAVLVGDVESEQFLRRIEFGAPLAQVVGDRPYACRAEKFTAARQTEGYDAIVVAATAKEVTRWRSESV